MSFRDLTSSPLSSAQSSQVTFKTVSQTTSLAYQSAQPLPFELLQHVQIYLEESLFSQALRFLLSLVSAGGANEKKRVPVPPPEYLAIIATLTVHPSFTTRTSSPDKLLQSNLGLKLLRTITTATGPVNSGLAEAYRFRRFDGRQNEHDDWRNQRLTLVYADSDSLFQRAEDFWAVVGWALNCSCLAGMYATRWTYWKPWLLYMLEVLEVDWAIYDEQGQCRKSLLWQYIESSIGGFSRARRILRAIFADGSESSIKEYHEVFRKELKEPKNDEGAVKKQEVAVDIEGDVYGDWMQEGDSSTDENEEEDIKIDTADHHRPSKRLRTRTPSTRRRVTPRPSKTVLMTDNEDSDLSSHEDDSEGRSLGGPESIAVRLRLLQLLSAVSCIPDLTDSKAETAFPDVHELYTLFVEFVRSLPLLDFQLIVLPPTSLGGLTPDARVTLCEFILQRMSDNNSQAKQRSVLEPMTEERFIREYLPHAAEKNTIEDQTKMSLLLESIMRTLFTDRQSKITSSAQLLEAIDHGINKREAKIAAISQGPKYKKYGDTQDELAKLVLRESGTRMRLIAG